MTSDRRAIAIRQTLAALAVLLVIAQCSCALFTKPFARSVLDFVQIACIVQNATLGDAKVAQMCSIANELMPDLRRILELQRAELARARDEGEYAAKHPAPVLDAGVPSLLLP